MNGQHPKVKLVWGEKAQNWLGTWGLADWMYYIFGQVDHIQGHISYPDLAGAPGQEQLRHEPGSLFQYS